MLKCDTDNGLCQVSDFAPVGPGHLKPVRHDVAVHYIGDPMCSWCWGISSTVHQVAAFCAAENMVFSMTMGGLRAGGGDAWDATFKNFLRNEWHHIAQVTGQPFGYSLLELPYFNYDTEPACRAVVTVQLLEMESNLSPSIALDFFAAIQRKFYVEGCDPKLTDFYQDICESLGINFDSFRQLFESPAAKLAVKQVFLRSRQWNVRAFPTLLLERNGTTTPLVFGFAHTDQVLAKLRQLIG